MELSRVVLDAAFDSGIRELSDLRSLSKYSQKQFTRVLSSEMYSHSNHVIKKINDLSSSKFTLKLTDVCGMIFHDPYLMIVKRSLDHVIRNAVMRASQNLNHRAR